MIHFNPPLSVVVRLTAIGAAVSPFGAYDKKCCRDAIRSKKSQALIPPPKNARYCRTNSERDQAIAAIRGLGGGKEARSIWGKLSSYNQRVLVETAFSRLKVNV